MKIRKYCPRPNEEGNLTIQYWMKLQGFEHVYYWTEEDRLINQICDKNLYYPEECYVPQDFEGMDIVVIYHKEDHHWCYAPSLDLSGFTELTYGTLTVYVRDDRGMEVVVPKIEGLRIHFYQKVGESLKKFYRITTQEIFYYLFFALLLFAKGIGLYDGQAGFKVFLILGLLCMAVKLCISQYNIRDIITIIIILGLTSVSYLVSGDKGMLLYGLMIIGMKDISIQRMFKIGLAVFSVAFGGLMLYSFINLYDSPYQVHDKLGLGFIFRWGLGYSHPNVLHISYFILMIFIVYVIGKKISWKTILWLFLGNCIVFLYSISYTGFAVVALFLIGILYVKRREKLTSIERILEEGVLLTCAGVSLILPVVLSGDHSLFRLMDKVLNNRLNLARHFLIGENINLFGIKLEKITSAQFTMDNAYVFAFIAYGIVLFSAILLLYGVLIYIYGKEQRNIEIIIILCILIAGLTEPFLFNTSFKNISFLFAGELLFRNSKSSETTRIWKLEWGKGGRYLEVIREQFIICRKQILLTSLFVGLLAGGIVFAVRHYPEGYIVPRVLCDAISDDFHYIEEAEDIKYQDYMILGNEETDSNVPMEFLNGNIVIMERVRGVLGTGIVVFAICIIIITAGYSVVKIKGNFDEKQKR